MHRYINIRSDARYAGRLPTLPLIAYLADVPDVVSDDVGMNYRSADGRPWCLLNLLHCNPDGGYSDDGGFRETVNLIELICSDYDETDRPWYEALAKRIAGHVGWEAVDDRDGTVIFARTHA